MCFYRTDMSSILVVSLQLVHTIWQAAAQLKVLLFATCITPISTVFDGPYFFLLVDLLVSDKSYKWFSSFTTAYIEGRVSTILQITYSGKSFSNRLTGLLATYRRDNALSVSCLMPAGCTKSKSNLERLKRHGLSHPPKSLKFIIHLRVLHTVSISEQISPRYGRRGRMDQIFP